MMHRFTHNSQLEWLPGTLVYRNDPLCPSMWRDFEGIYSVGTRLVSPLHTTKCEMHQRLLRKGLRTKTKGLRCSPGLQTSQIPILQNLMASVGSKLSISDLLVPETPGL